MGKRGKTGEHMSSKIGPLNNNWRGGIKIENGYKMVFSPWNPMCDRKGYTPEHRIIMAGILGRPLESSEIVHHINEDKLDNNPDNLVLMSRKDHLFEHLPVQFRSDFKHFKRQEICAGCGISFIPKRPTRFKRAFCSRDCFAGK